LFLSESTCVYYKLSVKEVKLLYRARAKSS